MVSLSRRGVGLVLGPTGYALVRLFPPAGLDAAGAAALACTLWVAVWWLTETAPIAVTALLPVVLFPVSGVTDAAATAAAYADPVTFLFLGGFLVALAVERWGLHRRIAVSVVRALGDDPRRLLGGFMLATASLSMWVSNTATAMLMVPIALSVVGTPGDAPPDYRAADATRFPTDDAASSSVPPAPESSAFGTALVLGVAYAASIGGVATLIGTPPNAILAAVVERSLGVRLDFVRWMLFGVPFAAVFLVAAWGALSAMFAVGDADATFDAADATGPADESGEFGALSTPERRVLVVFSLVVAGWLTRPFLVDPYVAGVTDGAIAVAGATLLFLVPNGVEEGALLSWDDATRLPWEVLLVFGGGFAIADAFQTTALDAWVGASLGGVAGLAPVLTLLVVATLVVFLTEVTSNSATASLFVPLAVGVAASFAVAPLVLATVVAVAASLAFMLPVATPPNAVVFGTGYVTVPEMARAGLVLNLLGVVLLAVAAVVWLPVVWGVSVVP
ncbi:solute carrier family 13 (sodium-dependent dicarboxylate transporter), member 2/3/5 [Halogeometricum rufum]|uniref:Solute carrier family 13 (Sodium-dependent dicarboxylate transporter), member 2/3/5 n=1 Tax=Halogeometricum rufum TaxID=553469 RepID=A0A1I6G7V8_9EURY|nr:SLC13 family permease [Halogeometricum rufum]SFR38275.1 solute carrier family 13 (sodium-dependent dicarboxylate transporter), member 2/3/5 [Halogeometricum rufum]